MHYFMATKKHVIPNREIYEYMNMNIWIKDIRTWHFQLRLKQMGHFPFLMWKYFVKTISLLLVSLERKRLVACTLISSVIFHLSRSFVWYTPYWIVVLIYLQTFWNSIMKLLNFRKLCRKMHIRKSLLINAFKNSLIISLFKGYKFLVYRKKNLE